MPTNAEDTGFIIGPIPTGENHENVIDMIAATANGVNVLENTSAALASQLTYRLTFSS
jgi:hypothetical protein